jgi:hypothetical protein
MNWKFWQKKKEEAPVFNTSKDEMEVAKVEPHFYFKDAMSKGIIAKEKLFSLNGKDYYSFADGLGMITAKRYLHYTSTMRFYEENGVNQMVSLDYLQDIKEQVEELAELTYDDMVFKKKHTEVMATISTFEYHYQNFNLENAIAEVCAIAIIGEDENPYDLDHNATLAKIFDFNTAMKATVDGGDDNLTNFFWRFSGLGSLDWIKQFKESMPSTGLSQESQEKKNHLRNLLILDLQKHNEHLQELRLKKTSSNLPRAYRVIYNWIGLRSNSFQS